MVARMDDVSTALKEAVEEHGLALEPARKADECYFRVYGKNCKRPFASVWLMGTDLTLHGHSYGKTTYDLCDPGSLDLFFDRLKSLARRAGLRLRKAAPIRKIGQSISTTPPASTK